MSGRRTVRFSLPILEYLKQLITDDLNQTDLDPDERSQARAALKRINTAIMAYEIPDQRPSHKTLMPYLKVPADIATAADWKVAYQRQQDEERLNHA